MLRCDNPSTKNGPPPFDEGGFGYVSKNRTVHEAPNQPDDLKKIIKLTAGEI